MERKLRGGYWHSQRNTTDAKTKTSTTITSSKKLIGRSTLLRIRPRDADAELWGHGIRACLLLLAGQFLAPDGRKLEADLELDPRAADVQRELAVGVEAQAARGELLDFQQHGLTVQGHGDGLGVVGELLARHRGTW